MEDTEEFAGELFVALVRRHGFDRGGIRRYELIEFWGDISHGGLAVWLEIFFDMCKLNDKLSADELKEVLLLGASANKLANIENHAEAYVCL